MNKILALWEKWSIHGVHLPYAHDPITKKPSITLLFPYITFVLSVVSIIALHFKPSMVVATSTTLIFWAASVVFYQLRKISKAKFDAKEGSFELDAGNGSKSDDK